MSEQSGCHAAAYGRTHDNCRTRPELDMSDPSIYLASSSPRRQELLRQIGIEFEVMEPDIIEQPKPDEPARRYVVRLAAGKARCVAERIRKSGRPPRPVLGADTEVVVDGEILGKPRDRDHACGMLRQLSGRTHLVFTAICILHKDMERTILSESHVTFCSLSEADLVRYWNSGEPAGKAGGYAIQGRAAAFVSRLEGSYSGVMGLPLHELALLLRETGIPVP